MQGDELIQELPKGLIKWYSFNKTDRILCVIDSKDSAYVFETLKEQDLQAEKVSITDLEKKGEAKALYDIVIMAMTLEHSAHPADDLKVIHDLLKPSGRLLLATDNRLGIRYFCGDRDPFTNRNFDGIENYIHISSGGQGSLAGRTYAKAELLEMLQSVGFYYHKFYSVFPDVRSPQVLLAEDYSPQEELGDRIFPQYHYPDTVFLEEEKLYTTLIQNGVFHTMANGFFIECPLEPSFSDINQITVSMERGRENAMYTILRCDGLVEKKPVYEDGHKKLPMLLENIHYLRAHGLKMINGEIQNGTFVMPYVEGITATNYFQNLFQKNKKEFLKQLDEFWKLILNSSETIRYEDVNWEQFEPGWEKRKPDDPNKDKWRKIAFGSSEEQENLGVILKRGYIDLVSLNCFWTENEFVFYDQELYIEHLPARAILLRTIDLIYSERSDLEMIISKKDLMERYHLNVYENLFRKFIFDFLDNLRNDMTLSVYHTRCRRDYRAVHLNRQRMNFSADEYERLFRNIFDGIEGKEIYLFGSGIYAKKFLSQFGKEYHVAGIIDNNPEKWGANLQGTPIVSPEFLDKLRTGSYKVIICIKNYIPVLMQLKGMGIQDYGIFDGNMQYPRKLPAAAAPENTKSEAKKYHVGYIAGVFDLYHIGHLNMFKRAKEQCEYLIVGVVTDESVQNNKKTMPFVPFEERIEMVRSCKYVDEAVKIPTEYGDTDEAYRRYQFDVQFSGSDYADDPIWLAKKAFLQKHGADMVFFPYTQATSSTELKELIRKKLL